jgi:hypothetical protein
MATFDVTPMVTADGRLCWCVRGGGAVAMVDADTGEVAQRGEAGEAFTALVGALREWYKLDRADYYGLNAMKVRAELTPFDEQTNDDDQSSD